MIVILSESKEPEPFDAASFSAAPTVRPLRYAQGDKLFCTRSARAPPVAR